MSTDIPQFTDSLTVTLERIKKGGTPESPYELLHHKKARELIGEITRENITNEEVAGILEGTNGSMTAPLLLHILQGKRHRFQGREQESATGYLIPKLETVISGIQAHVERNCGEEKAGDHIIHSLCLGLSRLVSRWINGEIPLTVDEMKIFEERTRDPRYAHTRDYLSRHGTKPKYALKYILNTGIQEEIDAEIDRLTSYLAQNTSNTVWTNLLLSAIVVDDYEGLATMLQNDDPKMVATRKASIDSIRKHILGEPIIRVSPQMFFSLMNLYERDDGVYSQAIRDILDNESLSYLRDLIPQIVIDYCKTGQEFRDACYLLIQKAKEDEIGAIFKSIITGISTGRKKSLRVLLESLSNSTSEALASNQEAIPEIIAFIDSSKK